MKMMRRTMTNRRRKMKRIRDRAIAVVRVRLKVGGSGQRVWGPDARDQTARCVRKRHYRAMMSLMKYFIRKPDGSHTKPS